MSAIDQIVGLIRGTAEAVAQMRMPVTIEVRHPETHPLAGELAGILVLRRDAQGSEYRPVVLPSISPREAIAANVISHQIRDIDDVADCLERHGDGRQIYVYTDEGPGGGEAVIRAVDDMHPELGVIKMSVFRHPSYQRWRAVVGHGEHCDISHGDLADLVLDNRGDLVDPKLADILAQFRSAREVIHDADLGAAGSIGVRVQWKGSGGREGATSDVVIPDEIHISIPAYSGAWPGGQEPRHAATISLRVLPPQDDGAPLFRLTWRDAADYEIIAASALIARVREVITDRPVYHGVPIQTHVVLGR